MNVPNTAKVPPVITQPQAESRNAPDGYSILAKGSWREAGDLIYTVAGWIVCNLTTGQHPEDTLVSRRRNKPPGSMGDHAPLKMSTPPHWTTHATPLCYIVSEPFAEKDEHQLQTFQLRDLRKAVEIVRNREASCTFLQVLYLDHKTDSYKTEKLMWDEFEPDPTHLDPKNHKRVLRDPFGLFCF